MDKSLYTDWEELTPKVYRIWLNDNQIVVYKTLDASRQSVDAWADGILETYQRWQAEQPYLAVYDVAAIMTMTPYSRARIKELVETAKKYKITGRYGIVLSSMIVSNIMRLFVRRELDRQNTDFVREFFHTQEDAIQWLQEAL